MAVLAPLLFCTGCFVVAFPEVGVPELTRIFSDIVDVPNPSTEYAQVRIEVFGCDQFAGTTMWATLWGTEWVIGNGHDGWNAKTPVCDGGDGRFIQFVHWTPPETSWNQVYTAAPGTPFHVRFEGYADSDTNARFMGRSVLFDLYLVHCPGDDKVQPDGSRSTIPPCTDPGVKLT